MIQPHAVWRCGFTASPEPFSCSAGIIVSPDRSEGFCQFIRVSMFLSAAVSRGGVPILVGHRVEEYSARPPRGCGRYESIWVIGIQVENRLTGNWTLHQGPDYGTQSIFTASSDSLPCILDSYRRSLAVPSLPWFQILHFHSQPPGGGGTAWVSPLIMYGFYKRVRVRIP